MSDDQSFPRNYDFCVSVLSSSFKLLELWPGLDEKMKKEHPDIFGKDGIPLLASDNRRVCAMGSFRQD